MANILLKIRKYLRVTKISNEIYDLELKRKSIDWKMHMDSLNKEEINYFNNEDIKISALLKVKKAQLSIYKNRIV